MTTPSPPTTPATAEPQRPDGPSVRARTDAARALRLLTPREAQVLARLAAGDDAREAAEHLGLAPATVRTYIHRAMRKLGVTSREDAIALTGHLDGPTTAALAPAAEFVPAVLEPLAPPVVVTDPEPAPPDPTAAAAAAPGAVTEPEAPPTPAPTATPGTDAEPQSASAPAPTATPGTDTEPQSAPAPAPASPTDVAAATVATPGPAAEPEVQAPTATPGTDAAPESASAPAPTAEPAMEPVPAPVPEVAPASFAEFSSATHARLVQQTFLLTGHRHRATHCVNLALGDASRRWSEVSRLPDPEGWARARAFESALSPWHRGGPRRAHLIRLPHRRITVRPAAEQEAPNRLTPRDRALLKALHRLTRPQRQALVLHDALGRPASEVAAEVESSTAAAEGRVLAARAALACSVPDLVGADPYEEGFGERLGGLLYRAAVRGCPSPRLPAPALLRSTSRMRSAVTTGAAGLLSVAMGTAMVSTMLGNGPSDLFRPAEGPPPALCSSSVLGSAGPVAAPGAEPGLRSAWCSPAPGLPARFVAPPVLIVAPQDSAPVAPASGVPSPDVPSSGVSP